MERESEVTVNSLETDFEQILNSSNITTEAMTVKEAFEWTRTEITRLIQIIFRPILIIAGTVEMV